MCISPNRLSSGVLVACRDCWQCEQNRINDWTGRCIAESKVAVASHMVTLTYGRDELGEADHENAAYLTYSDVQKFFKALRYDGYDLSYLAVGEYGTAKGRAHWHVIIFWQDKVPDFNLDKRETFQHWPHGLVMWQKCGYESFRYAIKYVYKSLGSGSKQTLHAIARMSKVPPIGARYFDGLARRYAAAGMAPTDGEYYWPDVKNSVGKIVKFRLSGRVEEMFIASYIRHWREIWGGKHIPASDYVEAYQDKVLAGDFALQSLLARLARPRSQKAAQEAILAWDRIGDYIEGSSDEVPQWQDVVPPEIRELSQARLEMEEFFDLPLDYWSRAQRRTK